METETLNTPLPQCNNTGMCHSKACVSSALQNMVWLLCLCCWEKERICTVPDSFWELLVQQNSFEYLGFESL